MNSTTADIKIIGEYIAKVNRTFLTHPLLLPNPYAPIANELEGIISTHPRYPNPMGLDAVEIVLRTEDLFDLHIEDAEAGCPAHALALGA